MPSGQRPAGERRNWRSKGKAKDIPHFRRPHQGHAMWGAYPEGNAMQGAGDAKLPLPNARWAIDGAAHGSRD